MKPDSKFVRISNITPYFCRMVLDVIYTETPPDVNDPTTLKALLKAAGVFKIQELFKLVGDKLVDQTNDKNSLDLFFLAHASGHCELKVKAYDVLKRSNKVLSLEDEWIEKPQKVAKIINGDKIKKGLICC